MKTFVGDFLVRPHVSRPGSSRATSGEPGIELE